MPVVTDIQEAPGVPDATWLNEYNTFQQSYNDQHDVRIEVEQDTTLCSLLSQRNKSLNGKKQSQTEELRQEMKVLKWHKLANEAALKAAIIKTNQVKMKENRVTNAFQLQDATQRQERLQQIIDEEALHPLQVNPVLFQDLQQKEVLNETALETGVARHISQLRRLKEQLAHKDDLQRRRIKYKEGVAELKQESTACRLKSSKRNRTNQIEGGQNNQENDISPRQQFEIKAAAKLQAYSEETSAVTSLDKLMELEKRIQYLEDTGKFKTDSDGTGQIPTSNMFTRRKSTGTRVTEASKTVYTAIPNKTPSVKARRKGTGLSNRVPTSTFLTQSQQVKHLSAEVRQKQTLRRMTDRQKRQFTKLKKEEKIVNSAHKSDVIIADWLGKKKAAALQRRKMIAISSGKEASKSTISNQSGQRKPAVKRTNTQPTKLLPTKAPLRGAAAGPNQAVNSTHIQSFRDIKRGFEVRSQNLRKAIDDKQTQAQKKERICATQALKKQTVSSKLTPGPSIGKGRHYSQLPKIKQNNAASNDSANSTSLLGVTKATRQRITGWYNTITGSLAIRQVSKPGNGRTQINSVTTPSTLNQNSPTILPLVQPIKPPGSRIGTRTTNTTRNNTSKVQEPVHLPHFSRLVNR